MATATSRIESEGARMARLVDDLFLLAPLDKQRGTEQRPVDLVSLANDAAVDSATVALTSTPGTGTRFVTSLPIADQEAS